MVKLGVSSREKILWVAWRDQGGRKVEAFYGLFMVTTSINRDHYGQRPSSLVIANRKPSYHDSPPVVEVGGPTNMTIATRIRRVIKQLHSNEDRTATNSGSDDQ